ncbi:MAG: fibronectin type III domain-containing protein [Bacteroidales bacterium]|nr:fibronectin type III domain-containing protein [Bacteroidales bacterium]
MQTHIICRFPQLKIFLSTIDSSSISGTSAVMNGLLANTEYFWRVNASNIHGIGAWSIPWSFTT